MTAGRGATPDCCWDRHVQRHADQLQGFAFGLNFDSDLTIPWETVSQMPADVQVIGLVLHTIDDHRVCCFRHRSSQWRFANNYWTDSQDLIGVIGSTAQIRSPAPHNGLPGWRAGDDILDGGSGWSTPTTN